MDVYFNSITFDFFPQPYNRSSSWARDSGMPGCAAKAQSSANHVQKGVWVFYSGKRLCWPDLS